MNRANLWPVAMMLALAACAPKAPPPSPPIVRPAVARAVLQLQVPADLDPHGDVVIPRDAIVHKGSLPGVFVLSKHKHARFRLVKIGATTAHAAQILSGLSGTETLVLPPFRGVHDGTPIHPQPTTIRGPHGSR